MYIDLQVHSTYSDGYLTPTELAEFLATRGVEVASLTDHNTVGGVDEFRIACEKYGIKTIPGLELYVRWGQRRFNLLWYNFDEYHPELHEMLRRSHIQRKKNVRSVLRALKRMGFKLDVDKIVDSYSRYVPINHVVDDFMSVPENARRVRREMKLKNPREHEIIRKYFKSSEIGELHNNCIDVKRIFELRKKVGGQIVLCHPAKYSYIDRKFLARLKKIGLDGIELFSPHHNYGAIVYIQQMAAEFGFICTGGSDFHRFDGGRSLVQHAWQYFHIRASKLKGIKRIINAKQKKGGIKGVRKVKVVKTVEEVKVVGKKKEVKKKVTKKKVAKKK